MTNYEKVKQIIQQKSDLGIDCSFIVESGDFVSELEHSYERYMQIINMLHTQGAQNIKVKLYSEKEITEKSQSKDFDIILETADFNSNEEVIHKNKGIDDVGVGSFSQFMTATHQQIEEENPKTQHTMNTGLDGFKLLEEVNTQRTLAGISQFETKMLSEKIGDLKAELAERKSELKEKAHEIQKLKEEKENLILENKEIKLNYSKASEFGKFSVNYPALAGVLTGIAKATGLGGFDNNFAEIAQQSMAPTQAKPDQATEPRQADIQRVAIYMHQRDDEDYMKFMEVINFLMSDKSHLQIVLNTLANEINQSNGRS